MPAITSTKLLPIDDPTIDIFEAQKLMQRLLADKIDCYAGVDEIRLLLVSGAQADGVVTEGLTPLHYACHRGYFAAAKLLLVRGAKVNAVDAIGYSALHLCAEKGYYQLIKLLIEYMAHVCYVQQPDQIEFPSRDLADEPLHLAIERGHYECAKLLLENGADPNTKYFMGPEITLVSSLETNFIRLLLNYGADPNVYSRDGLTPLMKACRHREKGIKTAKVLLDFNANINAHGRSRQEKKTALHYAVLSGSIPLINFLLENGACVNMPKDYDKPSILDTAILKDNLEIVKIILDAGADPSAMHGNLGTALHIALCTVREYQYDMIELLLKYGADPNHCGVDFEGRKMRSPFVEYMRSTILDPKIVILLLSYGGKVIGKQSQQDSRGQLRNIVNLLKTSPIIGQHMLDLTDEIDYQAMERLCVSEFLSSETKEHLVEYTRNPRSLQQLTRLRLRSLIQPLKPEKVETLPLPPLMKNFILGTN
jgi:ankyrin repeat protein